MVDWEHVTGFHLDIIDLEAKASIDLTVEENRAYLKEMRWETEDQ